MLDFFFGVLRSKLFCCDSGILRLSVVLHLVQTYGLSSSLISHCDHNFNWGIKQRSSNLEIAHIRYREQVFKIMIRHSNIPISHQFIIVFCYRSHTKFQIKKAFFIYFVNLFNYLTVIAAICLMFKTSIVTNF